MRRGYRKKVKRKIRAAVVLWILGVLASALIVFFASFWITSLVLRSGRDPVVPAQSDAATPPVDTQTQDVAPNSNQTDENTEAAPSAIQSKTEEPKKETSSEKPEAKPAEAEKPKTETKKEETEKPAAEKPAVEEKPSTQPSVEPEKPVTSPEPTPTPAPTKPTIEIISPNAG